MKIINPEKTDIIKLKEMWKKIFSDTDYYINLFFERKFSLNNTYIIKDKDKIISMLYSYPCKLKFFDETIDIYYLCGIATDEEYRSKGYSSQIINHVFNELIKKNIKLCFLIPANEGLFNFYKRLGFEPFTYLDKIEIKLSKKVKLNEYSKDFDFESLDKFYKGLNKKIYIKRDYNEFKDIFDCYKNIKIFDDGYIIYYIENNILNIIEHTYSFNKIEEIANAILYEENLKSAYISSPYNNENSAKPFTAVKFLENCFKNREFFKKEQSYINLMLN